MIRGICKYCWKPFTARSIRREFCAPACRMRLVRLMETLAAVGPTWPGLATAIMDAAPWATNDYRLRSAADDSELPTSQRIIRSDGTERAGGSFRIRPFELPIYPAQGLYHVLYLGSAAVTAGPLVNLPDPGRLRLMKEAKRR